MIPFLIIQYQLFVGLSGSIKAQPESARGLVSSAPYITVITSLFYPTVFVLPMIGLTGAAATGGVQVGYSIADVLAKAVLVGAAREDLLRKQPQTEAALVS